MRFSHSTTFALLASANALSIPDYGAAKSLAARQVQAGQNNPLAGLSGLFSDLQGALSAIMANPTALLSAIPKKKAVSEETIPSTMRQKSKDSIRKRQRFGPYKLNGANSTSGPGAAMGQKGMTVFNDMVEPICTDCIVLAGQITVEYPDGSPADVEHGVYNHHTIIEVTGKSSKLIVCPPAEGSSSNSNVPADWGTMPASSFIGGAADGSTQLFGSADGEMPVGFFLRPNNTHMLTSMLVNYNPNPADVYLVAEAEYVPHTHSDWLDSRMTNINVAGCDQIEFKINNKVESKSSGEWTVPGDGYIMNMQGHMHAGGTNVELILNGKSVCVSSAVYGNSNSTSGAMGGMSMGGMKRKEKRDDDPMGHSGIGGAITSVEKCTEPVTIKKGDKLKATANFDLVKHPVMEEGQGLMALATIMFAFPESLVY